MIRSFKKKTMIYKQPLIYLFFHFYFNAIDTEILTARSEFMIQFFSAHSAFLQTREEIDFKPERFALIVVFNHMACAQHQER